MADIPITTGTGSASVATELVGSRNFQLIEVYGQGGSSILGINPDGSIRASIIGTPTVSFSGSPSISGAVTIVGNSIPNGSISGTVGASVIGTVPVVQSGAWSSSIVGSPIPDTSVVGTITSVQSVSILTSGQGTVGVQVAGSFTGTVNFQGTIDGSTWNPTTAVQLSNGTIVSSASGPFTGQSNTAGLAGFRVLGNTVSVGVASVLLRAGAGVGTFMLDNPLPAGTNNIGQVTASVSGTVGASVIGTVPVVQSGVSITSIASSIPSSVLVGASIFGALPAGNAVLGAVAASISGTVATTLSGNPSISGTVGASVIGNVNTTITSIATINGGLSLWSPISSRIQGTADLRIVQGASVAAIAAQGAGVRSYIDHVQVVNFGSSSVLVTIADNTTSILGYTIAPAGGGSNYDTFYRPAANSPVTASINGTASVLVSMQGFTSST